MSRFPALAAALVLLAPLPGAAFLVTISSGPPSVFLQVGAGTITGGTYASGGVPGTNATINNVSVTLPAWSLGTGTQPMTTDSTVTNSPYDGRAYCPATNPATWVYVGGFYRWPGNIADALLTVTAPTDLVSGADTLPFSTISWVSGGIGDAVPTIASGTFVGGGPQTLLTVTRNRWFESCLKFSYANATVFPAGTYTNRVTYTLTVP